MDELKNAINTLRGEMKSQSSGGKQSDSAMNLSTIAGVFKSVTEGNKMAQDGHNRWLRDRVELAEKQNSSGGLKGISEFGAALKSIKEVAPSLGLTDAKREKPLSEVLIENVTNAISQAPGFNKYLESGGLDKMASAISGKAQSGLESLGQAGQRQYVDQ